MLKVETKLGNNNCAKMEIKMGRGKKTRRGKKRVKKIGGNLFGCSFEEESFFIQQEIKSLCKQKNFLRPSSPKAPMNSTQFLIEDSGNDRINLEMDSSESETNSPCHVVNLPSEIVDLENVSLYDEREKKCLSNEDEYLLMCFDDTTDFVGKEFEREFQMLQENFDNEVSTKLTARQREFRNVSREKVVEKYIKLENKLRRKEENLRRTKEQMFADMQKFLQENKALKKENEALKNLLS